MQHSLIINLYLDHFGIKQLQLITILKDDLKSLGLFWH